VARVWIALEEKGIDYEYREINRELTVLYACQMVAYRRGCSIQEGGALPRCEHLATETRALLTARRRSTQKVLAALSQRDGVTADVGVQASCPRSSTTAQRCTSH
jgi:hypothetical protein